MNRRIKTGILCVCVLLSVVTIMMLESCNTKKGISEDQKYMPTATVQQRYNEIIAGYKEWRTFTTSAKVSVSMGKSLSSNAQFSMEKDKWISLSIRPFLGIEIMRLYINNDSAFLVDKTHKAVVALGLKQFTGEIPVTVGDLQDMFMGRAFLLGSGTLDDSNRNNVNMLVNDNNGNFTVVPKRKTAGFNYGFTFSPANELQQLLITIDGDANQPWEVNYSGVTGTEKGNVVQAMQLIMALNAQELALNAAFDINKIKWDTMLDDSPGFKSDYKRMSITEFMKLW